jgi:putative flippase GtrA
VLAAVFQANRLRVPARVVQFGGWFALGVLAFGVELIVLTILHQWLKLSLWAASALAAELVLLGRFLTTDRLVFGYATPSFGRCWRFHASAAGSFAVSWIVLNSAATVLHVHYVPAAFLGSAAAFVWSALTNFLWVWRPGRAASSEPTSSA